jgi:hypothetical protein
MIYRLMKDFSTNDLEKFENEYPDRYINLCKIIGEFELDIRHFNVSATLPYKDDRGCVVAGVVENMKLIIIDTKYF